MAIYKYKNIKVDTKKMTVKWQFGYGDRIIDPYMIRHFKEVWKEKELKGELPFPFAVVEAGIFRISDDYEEK